MQGKATGAEEPATGRPAGEDPADEDAGLGAVDGLRGTQSGGHANRCDCMATEGLAGTPRVDQAAGRFPLDPGVPAVRPPPGPGGGCLLLVLALCLSEASLPWVFSLRT